MRRVQPQRGQFTRCEPWEEGVEVAGFFVRVEDPPPKCESRKIVLDRTGKNDLFAVWETAALARYTEALKSGLYYVIRCTGKVKYKNGRGWAFEVSELDESEIAARIGDAKRS